MRGINNLLLQYKRLHSASINFPTMAVKLWHCKTGSKNLIALPSSPDVRTESLNSLFLPRIQIPFFKPAISNQLFDRQFLPTS